MDLINSAQDPLVLLKSQILLLKKKKRKRRHWAHNPNTTLHQFAEKECSPFKMNLFHDLKSKDTFSVTLYTVRSRK